MEVFALPCKYPFFFQKLLLKVLLLREVPDKRMSASSCNTALLPDRKSKKNAFKQQMIQKISCFSDTIMTG